MTRLTTTPQECWSCVEAIDSNKNAVLNNLAPSRRLLTKNIFNDLKIPAKAFDSHISGIYEIRDFSLGA